MKSRLYLEIFGRQLPVWLSILVLLFSGCGSATAPPSDGKNISQMGAATNSEASANELNAASGKDSGNKVSAAVEKDALVISWSFSPGQYRGKNGQQYTFNCLANGSPGTVYGTTIFTDDSSVCTAAVHEGLITAADGGIVTIEIRDGQDAFVGSEKNGVKSLDFNHRWNGAFVFVKRSGGS